MPVESGIQESVLGTGLRRYDDLQRAIHGFYI
jgi:hypothetical protein